MQYIFKKYYSDFCTTLNSDEITAKIYSADVISTREKDEVIFAIGTRQEVLVNTLERAVTKDYKTFITFLDILWKDGTYKKLVEDIWAEF